MTIKINQSADRVDPPSIRLTGQKIPQPFFPGHPLGTYDTETISTLEEVVSQHDSDTEVRKRESLLYRSNIEVALIPDAKYTANRYKALRPTTTTGQKPHFFDNGSNGRIGTKKSDTYYTLNGKDPVRTKANLYTGKFLIKRNESGGDNTILKAKTYVNGQESKVMKVELRIIRPDENLV